MSAVAGAREGHAAAGAAAGAGRGATAQRAGAEEEEAAFSHGADAAGPLAAASSPHAAAAAAAAAGCGPGYSSQGLLPELWAAVDRVVPLRALGHEERLEVLRRQVRLEDWEVPGRNARAPPGCRRSGDGRQGVPP